ncbi:threonine aldolase family protein [Desertibaculum subflavum]|uniref:threonine aldolase family protein n=1 Tax=Desertibaculum subflavum TaxID=2268458 RepID=UPI000E66E15E
MEFRSDNTAGACPEIMAAIARANEGTAASYGADPISLGLQAKFSRLFEREVAVFPVATGTAANSLALAAIAPPWGVVYAHRESHIEQDECGAPEFFTGGAKLALLDGPHAKLSAADLDRRLAGAGAGVQHHAQPAAVSITQASERGAVYRSEEVAAIGQVCRKHRLALHMDGARFGNALAHLGCSPAEITWKAGVDILSFGATKNGALAAEAVVFFDPAKAEDFLYRRKRAGHLFSKMRFLSAQLDAYLEQDLWLRNAAHANAMARRLSEGLARLPGARLDTPVEANEVFIDLAEPTIQALEAAGLRFHRWEPGGTLIRLVTAWSTTAAEVDRVLAAAGQAVAGRAAE